jgi:hypothetical protein
MNIQLGYALLRDRRVSIRAKLAALGIGATVVGMIELLQIPFESVFAVILPVVGVADDLALDGAEAVWSRCANCSSGTDASCGTKSRLSKKPNKVKESYGNSLIRY